LLPKKKSYLSQEIYNPLAALPFILYQTDEQRLHDDLEYI
jgi:hypothetical protein